MTYKDLRRRVTRYKLKWLPRVVYISVRLSG